MKELRALSLTIIAILTIVIVPSVRADSQWWNGGALCDSRDYPGSYQLGSASFNGVIACGPGTTMGGDYNHRITYVGASVYEYEWECVEYSMRYMYLAYGVKPWVIPGNGGALNLVSSYQGSRLIKVPNDGASLPTPGDVLSIKWSATDTWGHTAVVKSISVDSSGQGIIGTIEQNASSTGYNSINVSNGKLASYVTGWLHDPNYTPVPSTAKQDVSLNADTKADLVVARSVGGFVVAYGQGNNTFAEGPLSLTGWGVPVWAGAGDFNGDGYSDVLTANPGGGFALALGHANGIFSEGGVTIPNWGVGSWSGTGNFYGDSRSDLVVARSVGGFAVAYGTSNGLLAEGPISLQNWSVPIWGGTGDFNGDGYTDILTAQSGGGFALALGHNNGVFTEGGVTLPNWGMAGWAGTGNFMGDSRTDLVVLRSAGGFAVAYGTPNGTLAEGPVSLTNWGVPIWAGTGDFNGDGYTDILTAQNGGGFALALGHNDGVFTEGGVVLPNWGPGVWSSNGAFRNTKGYGFRQP